MHIICEKKLSFKEKIKVLLDREEQLWSII